MDAFFTILTGALVALPCAVLGCFLILRKLSMVGDAISHAVLPGIVIAFFLSGSLSSMPVLIGATLMGIFCSFLIEWLTKKGGVQADAAIGVVFTFLFAVGVILIAVFADNVHLDQDCVLHGEMAYVALDTPETGIAWIDFVPRPVWILSALTVLVFLFVGLGYKGLYLTTFDPEYALSIGVSIQFWYYLLMTAVSATTVLAFESVGAVLVVAFLIVPAASAFLLTDDLKKMLLLSCLFGVLAAVSGFYLSVLLNGSIAGAMSVCMGVLFVFAFGLQKLKWRWV